MTIIGKISLYNIYTLKLIYFAGFRFNVDGRTRSNLKAFQLMCDLGTSSTDVEINVRLSHLRKAVMCLKDALQSDTERLTFDTSSAAEKIKELQLAINIAGTTVYVIFAELNLNCF